LAVSFSNTPKIQYFFQTIVNNPAGHRPPGMRRKNPAGHTPPWDEPHGYAYEGGEAA
jgi:hypothetical protein